MTVEAVFFDLDGTLLNTLDDLCTSLNATLRNKGFPTHPCNDIRLFIGDGVQKLVERALPAHIAADPYKTEYYTREYIKGYAAVSSPRTRPYEGIPEVTALLKKRNIPMAVITNKPHEKAQSIVEKFFPDTFFAVAGQKAETPRKPSPHSSLEVSRMLGTAPENTLFVGDTNVDMETALSGGYIAAAALWGFRTREELEGCGAHFYLSHPAEIPGCLTPPVS
ncbi:MAG: HAD family hydrolase [Fibrobacterota bacterium]